MASLNQPIRLQVCERWFTTTTATLTDIPFFAAFLKPEWGSQQPDGSYFLDADPEIFEHTLRYLRHGSLPLFYARQQGFDHAKYSLLLAQADYFGIEELVNWVKEKKYTKAVQTSFTLQTYEADDYPSYPVEGDAHVENHVFSKTIENVYVCPRDILAHHGDRRRCGRQCENANAAQEDSAIYRNEERVCVARILQTTSVDHQKCRISFQEGQDHGLQELL